MQTRTNIVLDDELVDRAMTKAGVMTKKAAIDTALRAYVREPDWKSLLALGGSGVLADDYDPATLFAKATGRLMVSQPTVAYAMTRRAAMKPKAKAAVAPRRK